MAAMLRNSLLVVLSLFFTFNVSAAQSKAQAPSVVFVHASVIPMDQERVLCDQTVVTVNGRIVEIGPSSSAKVPRNAVRIDAKGRYLLPAFSDMHVHLISETWNIMLPPEMKLANKDIPFEDFFFPFLANGVTLVQSMSATSEELVLREKISRGELLGPRLILAPMIDGPKKAWPPPISTWVATPAEAREAVERAKHDGYDKIKVYSFLSKESYDAIIDTAGELHMDVIGHIPNALSLEYVLDAGQKLIAHSEEVAKQTRGDHSPEHIASLADEMAEHGVWMTPTLVTTRSILELFADSNKVLGRPESIYFRHPMQQGVWNFLSENIYKPIPAKVRETIRDDFETVQRPLTTEFHHHGGKLMTGTDTLFPGLVPGFALQRELKELVDVGLTPYEALHTSTTAPYEYLGESDRSGTVETGMYTDLVLLDANPLEDIANAAKVSGVLVRGRWVGGEEITRRMGAIAKAPRTREAARQ